MMQSFFEIQRERYDADASLQYLNARYYDPKLGMFLQPDWFEVQTTGVGTNRYSYSANDPVNSLDPNGNRSQRTTIQSLDSDPLNDGLVVGGGIAGAAGGQLRLDDQTMKTARALATGFRTCSPEIRQMRGTVKARSSIVTALTQKP